MPTRTKLCSTPGCPAPYEPEYSEWHRCWAQGIKGHKCFGGPTHCHLPKKGMGGHNPASKIVACLCQGMHDAVDNGFKYGNAVIVDGQGREVYRLWKVTVEPPGETLIERVIGEGQTKYIGLALADLPPYPQETAQDEPDTSYGPAPAVAQDWPVTVEPHGLLKGKTLPAVMEDAIVRYGRRALVIEGTLSWERYEELCATLETMEEAVGFWIGDLIIRGEQEFGERCYQPWTERGYKAERLRQYAWVAQQIPAVTRVPSLSFTHHRAVAALPAPEQVEWLKRAEDEGMSSRQLHECVTTRREPEGCQHEWQCQKCGATK